MNTLERYFSSSTSAVLSEDGYWTVVADMVEGVKDGDSPWESRAISAKSIDRDVDNAYNVALTSIARKFEALGQNLMSLPKELNEYKNKNPITGD